MEGGNHLSASRLPPSTKRSAFTLIEMIGVMAIMAILAAVVVPPLFRTLEEGQRVDEDANQEAIADALLRGIKAYRTFPNPNARPDDPTNGWVTLAKNFYPKGTNALRYVFPKATNWGKTERRVYLDPDLLTFLNGNFSMPSQGYSGSLPTNALRMYIVSSSKSDLELACGPNQPGQFMNPAPQDPGSGYGASMINDLLNWIKIYEGPGSANFGSLLVPQSIARWGTNSGASYRRGEFLHVKIIGLRDLISTVTLIDSGAPVSARQGNGASGSATNITVSTNAYSISLANWPTPILVSQPSTANFNLFSFGTGQTKNEYSVTFTNGTTNYPVDFVLAATPRYSLNGSSSIPISDYAPVGNKDRKNSTNFAVIMGSPIFLYDNQGNLSGDAFITRKESHFLIYRGAWSEE